MESRNASFFEDVFPCRSNNGSSLLKRTNEEFHVPTSTQEVEPRRSKRARTGKSFGDDFVTYLLEKEPQTYAEAVSSSEGPL